MITNIEAVAVKAGSSVNVVSKCIHEMKIKLVLFERTLEMIKKLHP